MEPLLMLCDADVAAGCTLEPFVVCSLCTVTRRFEAAGRSFQQTYERRDSLKHPRKSGSKNTRTPEEDDDYSEEVGKSKSKSGGGGSSSMCSGGNLRRILAYKETLYQILGVHEGASLAEIKKQYRKKVLEYHPDKAKSGGTSPPAHPSTSTSTSTDNSAEAGAAAGAESAEGGVEGAYITAAAAGGQPSSEHEAFLKLQEAYEALSGKYSSFRRQYDSALPFDESVPSAADCQSPEDFYKIFGAAFQRNARWSVNRPVPTLGDCSTPLSAVEEFYEFWFAFESWRDFGVHDEHDLDQAACRLERRWMERENARIKKKYIKNERARIQKLVETAHAADPRIKQQKEEERKKKEEEKAAQLRAREEARRAAEDQKRREEEEARSREEEAQRLLKQQQQERAILRKWRQTFRWLYRRLGEGEEQSTLLNPVRLQELSMALNLEEMHQFLRTVYQKLGLQDLMQDEMGEPQPLPEALNISAEQQSAVLRLYLEKWQKLKEAELQRGKAAQEEAQRLQEEKQRQAVERKKAQQSVWTAEELSLLSKALQKFPGGTARRWHQIASFLGTKTQEEEVQQQSMQQQLKAAGAAAAGRNGKACETVASSAAWTREQQIALESALAKFPSTMPPQERWSAIAEEVPGKTRKECVERFKQIRAAILAAKGSQ
ncbi:DnaJ domain-containing protein, putative [Eimeria maxima]|uniref:DnaJ domain-containing protein, putative n=1 Tax=Eimeria maxima TaxID=5804 RepID=U6M5B0_EIMMA|nr:DnaJ domain-containing protein, putative [Eimeria maxima]CDJ59422.1 DnaJ domain-containing protein, putative [Eimeria maxima]